ncbi:MAG TPA: sulfatase-like hydrolase/transferase [Phycisphaerae bacterium]|nr:sulfatase-like hydrolase/transferase [Phycisphaerae bacterium]HRR85134.1 sulfatase-like hydrolase/transferase [Phycisphaerae bacterium]
MASRFVASLMAVFILFGPYLSNSLGDLTRYLHMWQRSDMVLVLSIVVVLAALATLADGLLRKLARPTLMRLYHHLFVLVVGAGILANVAFYGDKSQGWRIGRTGMEMQTLWLILVAVVAYSFAKPASRLVFWCGRACLIASPVVPIVAFQLLAAPTYPLAADPLVSTSVVPASGGDAEVDRPPVYLFVFDEWSYERTFTEGAPKTAFPNLADLAARSVVFHDAHSPGEDTATSMPALLFQTNLRPVVKNGSVGFDRDGRVVPRSDLECLFSVVADQGYRRIMIGAFLPYQAWLGDQVDICRSYCYYPRADGMLSWVTIHGFNAVSYLTDPWSVLAYAKLKTRMNDRQILTVHERTRNDAFSVIRDQPAAAFAVIHYMLPHEPFILDPDGTYRGPDDSAWIRPNVEGYTRNLEGLDRLIGEFVQAMHGAGRFDDALVIVTSDHSWRFDPARKSGTIVTPVTHVPLLIKLPGQQTPVSISNRFETRRLGSLIRWVIASPPSPGQIESLVRQWVEGNAQRDAVTWVVPRPPVCGR